MRKEKRERSNPIIFYLITLGIGIFIFCGSFYFAFNFFSTTPETQQAAPTLPTINKFTAVINKIDNDSIKIFNMNTESFIKISDNVEIYDKDNFTIPRSKLSIGMIVDAVSDNSKIKSLTINKNSWKKSHVNNFKFDYNSNYFYYDGKKYSFGENILVMYKDNLYDIRQINPLSVITICGIDENICAIEINKGYGTVNFLNADKIVGGILKVDSKSPMLLIDTKTLELPEGHHNISITGDNIETYNKDFFINDNSKVELDLSNVQFKFGILKLKINEDDCTVYIDDKKSSASEPILLNYGEHSLKVEKEDFNSYSRNFKIDNDVKEIRVYLYRKFGLKDTIKEDETTESPQIYIENSDASES